MTLAAAPLSKVWRPLIILRKSLRTARPQIPDCRSVGKARAIQICSQLARSNGRNLCLNQPFPAYYEPAPSLYCTPTARTHWRGIARHDGGVNGARWQDADNLHITLRFIGEVDRHSFDDVVTALESVSFRPFTTRLEGVGHFETRSRAKAIWARVEHSAELADLQYSIEMACRRAGLPAETRKFVPHVTVARLNNSSAPVGLWLAKHGALSLGPWPVRGFDLFQSSLTENGAIYSKITSFQ